MSKNESNILTNFFLTADDRRVLKEIGNHDGSNNMSAVVRRLIRQEGRRLGLLSAPGAPVQLPEPVQEVA